jgi:FixJ family two-component response regulator
LPNRNIVFVVDDDPGMRRGVKRLLRAYGYDSVLFASAEAFQNHRDFEKALCVIFDIHLNDGSSGRNAINPAPHDQTAVRVTQQPIPSKRPPIGE